MKQNKSINEDIAAPRWTKKVPELDDDLPPSKTKLKAEADILQVLGVRLCALSKDKLRKLNLPEALEDAVLASKKITANGAMRRHRQFLGKLMRDIDPQPIEEQFARWDGKNNEENAHFHALERWRDRLIEDAGTLSDFLTTYPDADRQQLRTLIRNSQKEVSANKPPKSSRDLFKLIRLIAENQPEAN